VTDLEQRLRDELQKISERPDPGSIRPLRVPPARGRRRLARWLTPVAAVAAVLAVIAGVSLAGRMPGQPPASAVAPRGMPPYYVIVQQAASDQATTATVRDSRTGEVLTRVRLPRLQPADSLAISAAADGRTFLITDGHDLFLMRLAADGRAARLAPLAGTRTLAGPPPADGFNGFPSAVLSPDGRTVALEGQSACEGIRFSLAGAGEYGCRDNTIRLVSLATGATRTWSTRSSWQPGIWISWDGNSHVLFSWAAATKSGSQPSGYRLLNVAAAGGGLRSARMLPLPPPPVYNALSFEQPVFVTPDGRAVIASTFRLAGRGDRLITSIVKLSARTGRLIRVLREASTDPGSFISFQDQGCSVLALGPEGVHALVECTTTAPTVFGRIDDGRFTPLPGMPYLAGPSIAAAAW
jgi:hypothetical protein